MTGVLGRPSEESQGFKPDPGNPAGLDYRGASGNVSHGGTVNPSCNRKSRSGNPSPTAGRARFLSQWTSVQDRRNTSGRTLEIGKPINSDKRSETAEGVARESVKSCPRAGCERFACPVRRAGCGNGVTVEPL